MKSSYFQSIYLMRIKLIREKQYPLEFMDAFVREHQKISQNLCQIVTHHNLTQPSLVEITLPLKN